VHYYTYYTHHTHHIHHTTILSQLEEEEDLELGESGGNALGPGEAPDDDYIESDGDVQED
jgi:hypothetical protein